MRLRLFRSQRDQKGFFGGHKGVNFALEYKLDISAEERGLIDHYKVGEFIVHTFKWGRASDGSPLMMNIHVMNLLNGGILELRDFDEVTGSEGAIKQGACNLKALLEQMRKFGGEEVIEI
jgi:hypothetical protein